MQISPITKNQWKKVAKALIYAFLSGFTGTLTLFALDFFQAAQAGTAAVTTLAYALLAGAVIGGINAVAFAIQQLVTEDTSGK